MKNHVLILLVMLLSHSVFAGINEKQVIGKWNYSVNLDEGELTGTLNFFQKDGILAGEVITSEGETFSMTKVELKGENILYFELQPEYDVIKVTLTIEENKYRGMGSTYQGDFILTGEKKL